MTNKVKLNIEYLPNYGDFPKLKYAYENDACFDVRAAIDTDTVTIKAKSSLVMPLGVRVEIPIGYELRISPRSGLAFKHGIGMINSIGVIDTEFRGEMKIVLFNFFDKDFVIHKGDRIAQARLCELITTELTTVELVKDSKIRPEGGKGRGSSGVK